MPELYTLRECNTSHQIHEHYSPASADQILEAARQAIDLKIRRGASLTSPAVVKDYLIMKLAGLEHEVFAVLFLDSHNQLIEYVEMFRGSITTAFVYPREVLKETLRQNAAGLILAHNHPSGDPEPSNADMNMTQRLKSALSLIDVPILDHIIVAGQKTVSFAEMRLL